MTTVISVLFHHIHPSRDVEVPLADAWRYWEDAERRLVAGEPGWALDGYFKAKVTHPHLNDGQPFETFAKAWTVWDFTNKVHRLVRIGLGDDGDGGPCNPDLGTVTSVDLARVNPAWVAEGHKWTRVTQHLVGGDWVSGINWQDIANTFGGPVSEELELTRISTSTSTPK